jgi:hypothetical protein
MTASLALTLMAIGFLDSINPSLFIGQFFLLTTPKPTPRIITYILGILVVNFFGGLLVLLGLSSLIQQFVSSISTQLLYGAQLVLGIALFIFGLRYAATPLSNDTPLVRSLTPIGTFIFGMVVMVNELTTALPYFVAIERIADARLDFGGNILSLVLYNLVFALPLFGFLGALIFLRKRFTDHLTAVITFVNTWTPRILKYAAIIFGIILVINALTWLLNPAV